MKFKAAILTALLLIVAGLFFRSFSFKHSQYDPLVLVSQTWDGFKHFFVDVDGRVNRPKDNDVVSEGQAYAMLRAVWMDDQKTFDMVFRWSEANLSRKKSTGDHLLAWRWKGGKVVDNMPASDADIDYALSLIFAQSRWSKSAEDYGQKAEQVLSDILDLMTVRLDDGRLYLLPWIVDIKEGTQSYPLNPSYYSPAHFRIFYQFTEDERWLELVDTTYYLLLSVSQRLAGQTGAGLVPDWCAVNREGTFSVLEGESTNFGWEAIRVPFRVALDKLWFNEERAGLFLSRMTPFLEEQWQKHKAIYSEYGYDGSSQKRYENPAFYAAYYFALKETGSEHSRDVLEKIRKYIRRTPQGLVYLNQDEYFVNSLSWLVEGLEAGLLRNLHEPL